jgi:hypothetical protein
LVPPDAQCLAVVQRHRPPEVLAPGFRNPKPADYYCPERPQLCYSPAVRNSTAHSLSLMILGWATETEGK